MSQVDNPGHLVPTSPKQGRNARLVAPNHDKWGILIRPGSDETTLFPVLLPLAPAASLAERFPEALESILKMLGVNTAFIASERWAMSEASFSKSANRSVLGVMNRLELEMEYVRDRVGEDLLELSLYLSDQLFGPLRGTEFRPLRRS